MVIFAEPVFTTHLQSKFSQLDSNAAAALLLPGDRLLEVNGRNVQDTSREDIIDIIRQSGSSVTLRVSVRPKIEVFTSRQDDSSKRLIVPSMGRGPSCFVSLTF